MKKFTRRYCPAKWNVSCFDRTKKKKSPISNVSLNSVCLRDPVSGTVYLYVSLIKKEIAVRHAERNIYYENGDIRGLILTEWRISVVRGLAETDTAGNRRGIKTRGQIFSCVGHYYDMIYHFRCVLIA